MEVLTTKEARILASRNLLADNSPIPDLAEEPTVTTRSERWKADSQPSMRADSPSLGFQDPVVFRQEGDIVPPVAHEDATYNSSADRRMSYTDDSPPSDIATQPPPLPPPEEMPPVIPDNNEVIWASDVVITAPIPFEPEVSYPPALERAKGMGHIELGDLEQIPRGSWNGLVDLGKLAVWGGPLSYALPPSPLPSMMDRMKADIDPRYGGGAIIGEHLAQNLALEGLGLIPEIARLLKGIGGASKLLEPGAPIIESALNVKSVIGAPNDAFLQALGVPTVTDLSKIEVTIGGRLPVDSDRAWARYQLSMTAGADEQLFYITENGVTREARADDFVSSMIAEAKYGKLRDVNAVLMGKNMPEHIFNKAINTFTQLRDYYIIAEKLNLRGVRYMVSDMEGVEFLQNAFKTYFPDIMASGKVSIWHAP
jgi:hypothetical protein